MSGEAAVGTVGDDHLRTNLTNALHQLADNFGQVSFGKVRVLVTKDFPMLYSEQAA